MIIGYLLLLLASVRRRSQPRPDPVKLVQKGDLVPHFYVMSKEDEPVDLIALNFLQEMTQLLLFVGSADCKGCHRLWMSIVEQGEPEGVAFIWLGGVPQTMGQFDSDGRTPIRVGGEALRWEWEFADLYGATQGALGIARVPVAVLLDDEGRVLERPSLGQDAVWARWNQWIIKNQGNSSNFASPPKRSAVQ